LPKSGPLGQFKSPLKGAKINFRALSKKAGHLAGNMPDLSRDFKRIQLNPLNLTRAALMAR
jgi:hypothetical protein